MAFGPERLAAALAAMEPDWPSSGFCVALSGGLDSTVLLHLMVRLRAGNGRLRLRAVHVDHGLQPGSPAWAQACAQFCRSIDVRLRTVRLGLVPAPGESVEAEARRARYAAIAGILEPGEWLLTAHHRDDQMETVLIQLLRGAGVAGLAAMPSRAHLGPGWHGRPLLDVDRAALADYARQAGLSWVADPMNSATRYDRGWLRERVLPAVRERWPGASATVARSASHLAEAAGLLAGLAESDAAGLLDGGRLSIAGLQHLPRERRVNLLRWWIRQQGLGPPPTTQLASVLDSLVAARVDGEPVVRWSAGELRRYRGRLYAMRPLAEPPSGPWRLELASASGLELGPGLGRFSLVATRQGGLGAPPAGEIELRFRAGGETLRPHPARPRKRLMQLCQEAGIVPWMRPRLPLVFVGSRLAAVGDLWIDAELAVAPGLPALAPLWSGRPELF